MRVFDCLSDYRWCDVSYGPNRGWVYAGFLSYTYQNRRVVIYQSGSLIGFPIITFSIGTYWDTYYRGRPWYRDRSRYYKLAATIGASLSSAATRASAVAASKSTDAAPESWWQASVRRQTGNESTAEPGAEAAVKHSAFATGNSPHSALESGRQASLGWRCFSWRKASIRRQTGNESTAE